MFYKRVCRIGESTHVIVEGLANSKNIDIIQLFKSADEMKVRDTFVYRFIKF